MKRNYNKPETEIIDMEPQQMICTSGGVDEPRPDDEEWFDMDDTSTPPTFHGVLD